MLNCTQRHQDFTMTRHHAYSRPVAGFVLWSLLRAIGLGLLTLVVLLGVIGLRSLPLAGQLWNRPELARANQQPVHASAQKPPAEVPFMCC
jgi:hypothetical protein